MADQTPDELGGEADEHDRALARKLAASDLSRESRVKKSLKDALLAREAVPLAERAPAAGWAWSPRRLAFAALLAVVGLGGGAGARFWLSGRAASPEAANRSDAFRRDMSERSAAVWARLLDALRPEDPSARPLSVEGLVGALLGHKDHPAATAFAADFQSNPALMDVWDKYRRAEGALGVEWLARELAHSNAFIEILNQHAPKPGFEELSEGLASGIKAARVAELSGAASASPSGPRDRIAALAPGGGAPSGPPVRVALSPNAGSGGSARKDNEYVTKAQHPTDAHATLKLKSLKAAGPSRATSAWASLCFRGDPAITKSECNAISRYLGAHALWDACFNASLVNKCISLCETKPGLGCATQAAAMRQCQTERPVSQCASACSASASCGITTAGAGRADGSNNTSNNTSNDTSNNDPDETPVNKTDGVRSDDRRSDDRRSDDRRSDDRRSDDRRSDDRRSDDRRSDDRRSDDRRSDDRRSDDRRSNGDRSNGDRSNGDRSNGDRSNGDSGKGESNCNDNRNSDGTNCGHRTTQNRNNGENGSSNGTNTNTNTNTSTNTNRTTGAGRRGP